MLVPLNKYNSFLQCFAVMNSVFSEEEVEKIVFLEKLLQFNLGKVGMGEGEASIPNPEARDSDVSFIQPDENSHWLFQRLSQIIPRANYDHFQYDIDGIEAVQYTKYGLNQHYTWHTDCGPGHWMPQERKISVTIMLDDPDSYEGGELEVAIGGNPDTPVVLKPNKGEAVFFASWMPHRVRPVTSGLRRSLVVWVIGKRK